MAKEEQSNQLNLTVVALVALVAIVGLVALVMNAASIAKLPTGSQIVSAEQNTAGQVWYNTWGDGVTAGGKCTDDNQCKCARFYVPACEGGKCVCNGQ